MEMSSISSACSDDSDGGPKVALIGVSYGKNIRKLIVERFYRHYGE